MSTITIRNIDDELKAKLRVQAAEHGRSMEAEVRVILQNSVERPPRPAKLGTWIHEQFMEVGGVELDIPARTEMPRYVDFEE